MSRERVKLLTLENDATCFIKYVSFYPYFGGVQQMSNSREGEKSAHKPFQAFIYIILSSTVACVPTTAYDGIQGLN